jgi:hypothetical protein
MQRRLVFNWEGYNILMSSWLNENQSFKAPFVEEEN